MVHVITLAAFIAPLFCTQSLQRFFALLLRHVSFETPSVMGLEGPGT